MSKSNKNSSNKCSAPAEAAGATCVLCHTRVSPEDMAVLKCGMVPIAHESTVHVACAEAYAASEANSFLKSERLPVICRLLGGGGASPNLVSNSTLKALGLQDMLEATGAERRKGSLTSTKGKMSDKYLRMAKNWANDESIAKKLLVAACPHGDGCFLTIETYKTPQQDDSGAAASEQASKAPRKKHLLAMGGPSEEADDKGRCVGTKQNGDACPRSANEHGGDAGAGLCRLCKVNSDRVIALATAAAAAEAVMQDSGKRASLVGAGTKVTVKRESGGIGAILKKTAKPVEICSSCGFEYYSKQENSSSITENVMCEECIRPLVHATAALAAENKANEGGSRPVVLHGKESPAKGQGKKMFQAAELEVHKTQSAFEVATAQRLAQLLNTLPNRQLVCGERLQTATTKTARKALKRHCNAIPQDGFLINKHGLEGFAKMHSKVLRWTPLAAGYNIGDAAGVITAAGRPGVDPANILARKIANEVTAAQSILVKRRKGGPSFYSWIMDIPAQKNTPDFNFIISNIFGKNSVNLRQLKEDSGCEIWVNFDTSKITIQGPNPKNVGKAVAHLQPILDAPGQRAQRLYERYGYEDGAETSSYEGSDYWEGEDDSLADPSCGSIDSTEAISFGHGWAEEWDVAKRALEQVKSSAGAVLDGDADQGTDSETSTQGDGNIAAAVKSPSSSASEVTYEAAETLAEAGPTIRLLRENRVSDAALLQLVEMGLTSLEQIMAAHDDGLHKLGIKLGPRMRILKILSPLLLKFEDEEVKDVLEGFSLGKYRARCAEEQIDVEALGFFAEEPDEALAKDLGVKPEDFEAFSAAVRSIGN